MPEDSKATTASPTRPTIRFQVPIPWRNAEGRTVDRFLAVNGRLVERPEDGATFVLYRSPTPREAHRVDVLKHDAAGGLQEYVDLAQGAAILRDTIRERLESVLWPEGRPEAKGEEADQQDQRLQQAWTADTSKQMTAFLEMQAMLDRLQFVAEWEVLLVSATGPIPEVGAIDLAPEWRKLMDRPMDLPVLQALQRARWTTIQAAQEGKERPSGS